MWPHTKVYMVSHLLTHLMLSLWLTRFKGIRSDFEVCSSSIAVVHAPHREMRCVTVKTFSPDCKPGLMLLVHVCKALGEAKFDGLIVQRVHQTTTKLACHQRVWTFPADSESFVTLMFLAGEKNSKWMSSHTLLILPKSSDISHGYIDLSSHPLILLWDV